MTKYKISDWDKLIREGVIETILFSEDNKTWVCAVKFAKDVTVSDRLVLNEGDIAQDIKAGSVIHKDTNKDLTDEKDKSASFVLIEKDNVNYWKSMSSSTKGGCSGLWANHKGPVIGFMIIPIILAAIFGILFGLAMFRPQTFGLARANPEAAEEGNEATPAA